MATPEDTSLLRLELRRLLELTCVPSSPWDLAKSHVDWHIERALDDPLALHILSQLSDWLRQGDGTRMQPVEQSVDALIQRTRRALLQKTIDAADRHGQYDIRTLLLGSLTSSSIAEIKAWLRALRIQRAGDTRGVDERPTAGSGNDYKRPAPLDMTAEELEKLREMERNRSTPPRMMPESKGLPLSQSRLSSMKHSTSKSIVMNIDGPRAKGLDAAPPAPRMPIAAPMDVRAPRQDGDKDDGGHERLAASPLSGTAPGMLLVGSPLGDGLVGGWKPDGRATSTSSGSLRPRTSVGPQRVSMGLADAKTPRSALSDRTLAASRRYLLWVEISPHAVAGSLSEVAPLTELHEGDVIDVIVFPFRGQLALEGPRHGRVKLQAAGNQVLRAAWPGVRAEAGRPTLFFALQTPAQSGRFGVRCNFYCRGVLLQSHLVHVEVTARSRKRAHALDRELDYNLSTNLDTARIPADAACSVSWFLNDDGDGTHSFRFVSSKAGVPEHIGDAHVDGVQLKEMVQYAREALRWAAWGTKQPWTSGLRCRFADQFEPDALKEVLVELAMRGANLWMEIAAQFAFVGDTFDTLRELMRVPGQVQIALKKSIGSVIPMALIYDYPLDAAVPPAEAKICETAFAAIAAGRALVDEPCFNGACPQYGADDVVCPGGFWGFRHDLGLPLHLPKGQAAAIIPRGDGVRAFAPISTDQAFVMRDPHLAQLAQELKMPFEILRDRKACLDRLKEARQVVYFYCHGGITSARTPFLQVGALGSRNIVAQSLVHARISWTGDLRPLVILNGCHTTAASPDEMFSMLTAFATHCNAAGVIGTEITNFELIAGIFGRELLRHFLGNDKNNRLLGRAVRLGRLALLAKGNPLGLMYIPFALPGLQLE